MAGTVELTLSPTAVALHTRDRDDDYGWRVEVGRFSAVELLKDIHRELIADKPAHPATSLILLDTGDVLGLVVANLKSQRRDHTQTRIDDTLLAEFAPHQRKSLLLAVASLLDPSTAECRSKLLDYAEQFFQSGSGRQSADAFRIPAPSREVNDGLSGERFVAVRSNDTNLRRVASLLRSAAETPDILNRPFLLVSTGFVGPESLERFTTPYKQFVALSRSSSLPDTGVHSLKKKVPSSSRTFSVASVAAGVGGICLISFLLYHGMSSTNSPDDDGRDDRLALTSRVAAAVGLAAPGNGWATLAVIPIVLSDAPAGNTAAPDLGRK